MLVHFQKQRITSANFQGFLDAVGIGDQQIISNDLLLLTGPLASRTIDDSRGSGEPNESNLFCQTLKWFQSNMLFTVISAEDVVFLGKKNPQVLTHFGHKLLVGIPVILVKGILENRGNQLGKTLNAKWDGVWKGSQFG